MRNEQHPNFASPLIVIAVFFWLGLFSGCATMPRSMPAPESQSASPAAGRGWRAIRFRMDRTDEQTHWERDLLIAHRIIAPVLKAHAQDIPLWRFHRRSAEDNTGHQFSFLFYTPATTATLINDAVMADPLLKQMMTRQWVGEVLVDRVDESPRPNIEDTSDPNWSPVMQVAWPHYIMGVSRMWLEMIDRISEKVGLASEADMDQLIDHYATIDSEVSQIWRQEAYHALLHHLNAIYGYRPMIYWEKRTKTF